MHMLWLWCCYGACVHTLPRWFFQQLIGTLDYLQTLHVPLRNTAITLGNIRTQPVPSLPHPLIKLVCSRMELSMLIISTGSLELVVEQVPQRDKSPWLTAAQ